MRGRLLHYMEPTLLMSVEFPNDDSLRRLILVASEPEHKTQIAIWLTEQQIKEMLAKIQLTKNQLTNG